MDAFWKGGIYMVKWFGSLTEEAKKIREEVFVEEQGFLQEFDETDVKADHLVWYEAGEAAATCRYYAGEEKGVYWLGRLAVRKRFRGRQIGAKLLSAAEEKIRAKGGSAIHLSSQVRAKEFYVKCGYHAVGEEYRDEYCPHIEMKKELV